MIPDVTVNYLAVFAAAVLNMVLGMAWYSPLLMGKQWIKSMGKSAEELKKEAGNMGPLYGLLFLGSLVLAFFLAHFVKFVGASSWMEGALVGDMLWMGFVVTTLIPVYVFEGRNKQLYFIFILYQLVSFALMGALLAAWV